MKVSVPDVLTVVPGHRKYSFLHGSDALHAH